MGAAVVVVGAAVVVVDCKRAIMSWINCSLVSPVDDDPVLVTFKKIRETDCQAYSKGVS